MTKDELICYVTEEVLRRMSGSSLVRESIHLPEKRSRKNALILTAKSGTIDDSIKNTLESFFDCTFQNRERAYENELSGESFDLILLAELTNGQLASAGLGVPYGAEARPVLEAFCCGKKVIIVEEGISFIRDKCKSRSLNDLYWTYLDKMVSFGADVIKTKDLEEQIKRYALSNSTDPVTFGSECCLGDKVITEKLIIDILKKVPGAGKIIICLDALVTPLANDLIVSNKIEIIRSNERCQKP
ncbi:MAG: hypothetical protein GX056_04970 [Synergistaceae bacterium]|nr:hypothetical protein [Synergistaceae bacterium]NLW61742.1 hypothetical protein [Synergistaceae bacterium]